MRPWFLGLCVVMAVQHPVLAASKELEEFYELFADPEPPLKAPPKTRPKARSKRPKPSEVKPLSMSGSFREEIAARLYAPQHFSKIKSIFSVAGTGAYSDALSYKFSGRLAYDGIYDFTHHYPKAVSDDQRWDTQLRDTYVDYSYGSWDTRVGKQQIVWGEAVGSFVADVVNAKDFRELILQDFETIRIPEWGANLEYTYESFHAEGIWLPFPEMHKVTRPGGEFEPPLPIPSSSILYQPAEKPSDKLENSEYGTRLAYRAEGWDVAAFHLRSWDKFPIYEVAYNPFSGLFLLTETHPRQTVDGFTFAAEIKDVVYKGEFIYTSKKSFQSTDPTDPQGLLVKDVMTYLFGVDYVIGKWRTTYQLNQQIIRDHEDAIFQQDALETSVIFYARGQLLNNRLEPELTLIKSVHSTDFLARPKLSYKFLSNWRFSAGADIAGGPEDDTFGSYREDSRVYTEIRFDF